MKSIFTILAVTITTTFAVEIEPIPSEEVGKVARKIISQYGVPADAPMATEVDTEKAVGIKGGQAGLVVMPDKKLTAESLGAATEKPAAIGQLWMHKVVPVVSGTAPAAAKLRTVEFGENENRKSVEVYYLSVSKTSAGSLEMALTGRDKEPLVKVPLVKTDAAASTVPMAVTASKEGEHTGVLVLSLFGSYKADISITKAAE